MDDLDAGLLTPVRAGSAVAALTSDAAWLRAMLDVEAALARTQARLGTVPPDAAAAIATAVSGGTFDLRSIAVTARETANPVVAMVGSLRAAVPPSARDHVHLGATSQDILDTAGMLVASRCLPVMLADLVRVASAAAALAAEHRDTPMPGRTLAQHAVPVTFGLKAAGWLHGVDRATALVRRLLLPVQFGGAAGTLAGYLAYAGSGGVDPGAYAVALVQGVAADLGLVAPVLPWHTDRAPVVELAWTLATATGAVGKIAVDVRSLSRTEIAEVSEPAADGRGGSSAMPQKRNPVLSTMIISAATQIGALAGGLSQAMLAEDERPAGAWQAEWQPMRDCLRLAGGAAWTAAELVSGLTVDADRMRANLDLTGGLIVAERVAAALAPRLGRTAARTAVSTAAARTASNPAAVRAAPGGGGFLGELSAVTGISVTELRPLLDPAGYLGAAGALVDRALSARRKAARDAEPDATRDAERDRA